MESIFAKPPASTSHNYIYLLQKKEILGQNFKDHFSNILPSPVHLYTSGRNHLKIPSTNHHSPKIQESLKTQIFLDSEHLVKDFSYENARLKQELSKERHLGEDLREKLSILCDSIEEERKKHLK
jgi:hypothetical protein